MNNRTRQSDRVWARIVWGGIAACGVLLLIGCCGGCTGLRVGLDDAKDVAAAYVAIKAGDVDGAAAMLESNAVVRAVLEKATDVIPPPEGHAWTWSSIKLLANSDAWRDWFSWLPGIADLDLGDALPDWVPVPPGVSGANPLPDIQRAAFLLDNASTRCMNDLSRHISMAEFSVNRDRQRDAGANTLWLFLGNQGDGRGAPVSFYANDRIWGPVDDAALKQMHEKCIIAIDEGFALVFWMFADDSPENSKAALDVQVGYLQRAVSEFGRYAAGWCIALEADEHMGRDRVTALVAALDGLTDLPIYVHQLSGRTSFVNIPGIDGMMYQYGFGKSAAHVAADTRAKMAAVAPRQFIGSEYHKSSDTGEARSMGQAIIEAGAGGAGNGSY